MISFVEEEADMRTIDFLIANNMNVDEFKDEKNGNATFLMKMAFCWNLEYVKKLIEVGADVNMQDENGDTALFYAFHVFPTNSSRDWHFSSMKKLLDYLIENGALLNVEDNFGNTNTPIFYAMVWGIKEVEWCIKNGVDINAKNWKGESPLQFAIKRKKLEIAELIKNTLAVSRMMPTERMAQPQSSEDYEISTDFILALVRLSKIVEKYGNKITNIQKLNGLISDLFPQHNEFYPKLKQAFSCDFAELIFCAGTGNEERQYIFKQAVEMIVNETGLSKNDAVLVVRLITFSLDWELDF